MEPITLPTRPVENWEAVRDEWVAAVEQLISEAETWAARQDWGTLREPKTITEDGIGSYTVPRLLVHAIFGRVLLDPADRFVGGAEGVIDFFAIPSWSGWMIVRMPDGWYVLQEDAEGPKSAWSEQVFVDSVRQLAKLA